MSTSKKILRILVSVVSIAAPALASAQTSATLSTEVTLISKYLNQFLVFLMGLAVLIFVFYVIKYFIIQTDSETGRKEGRMYIMWSVVAFFVILSMWGIVHVLVNTFQLGSQGNTPTVQNIGSLFPQ